MGQQRRDDLAGFDAIAADLDLIVGAAQILQCAVRGAPHQIAGAVHPGPGRDGVGDEPARGLTGPAQVAAGQLLPSQVELPWTPSGTGRSQESRMCMPVPAVGRPIVGRALSAIAATTASTVASVGP